MSQGWLLFWLLVAVADAVGWVLLVDQQGLGRAVLAAVIGVVLALFAQSRHHTRQATRRH